MSGKIPVALGAAALTAVALLLMVSPCLSSGKKAGKDTSSMTKGAVASGAGWAGLLQRTAFPYLVPIPPQTRTVLDGTYTKVVVKEGEPVHCRR